MNLLDQVGTVAASTIRPRRGVAATSVLPDLETGRDHKRDKNLGDHLIDQRKSTLESPAVLGSHGRGKEEVVDAVAALELGHPVQEDVIVSMKVQGAVGRLRLIINTALGISEQEDRHLTAGMGTSSIYIVIYFRHSLTFSFCLVPNLCPLFLLLYYTDRDHFLFAQEMFYIDGHMNNWIEYAIEAAQKEILELMIGI